MKVCKKVQSHLNPFPMNKLGGTGVLPSFLIFVPTHKKKQQLVTSVSVLCIYVFLSYHVQLGVTNSTCIP